MFKSFRRYAMLVATMLLGMMLLVACGGSAADPVARVDSFVKDMNSAFSDAKLTETATQEKWADTLSKYYVADEQAAQKTEMLDALALLSSGSVKIEGAKFEKVSESGDAAEVKIVGGKMSMTLLGQTQEQDLATSGISGSSSNIKLKKVDGTWYMTNK
ncbi:MAG: hypothetical protein KAX40_04915 [Herpetosiphon sp.]|nr:hypothetical protein [Herpetosiphon sp.]